MMSREDWQEIQRRQQSPQCWHCGERKGATAERDQLRKALEAERAFCLAALAEANRRAKAGLKHAGSTEFQDYPGGIIEVGTALDAVDFVTSSAAHFLFEDGH